MPTASPSRIIDVSTFSGTDTSKFQQAFAKACKDLFATVYIPFKGSPWIIEDEIIIKSLTNDAVTFNLVADPCWYLIDFKGKSGQKCFRFFGYKGGTIDSVKIRTWGDNLTGFSWEGSPLLNSSGSMIVRNCRVQFWEGINGTGFIVGVDGDDYSASLFQRCEAYGDNGKFGSNLQSKYLKSVAERNHRGFVFNGGNNLYQKMDSCSTVDLKVGVTQLYQGTQNGPCGGAGLVVDNHGSTANNLVFQADGGMSFFARGGRHELGGALVTQGNPTGWQPGIGLLKISEMVVDAFRPFSGSQTGLYDPGAIISLRSCAKAKFDSVTFSARNGESLDNNALVLAHSNSTATAEVSFDNCDLTFNPHSPRRLAGAWTVAVQATKKAFGVSNGVTPTN